MSEHIDDKKYNTDIDHFRKISERHILIFEPIVSFRDKCRIIHYADLIRIATNELISMFRKRSEQLLRTKKFRQLKSLRNKYDNTDDLDLFESVTKDMHEMCLEYEVTWELCDKLMAEISEKYHIDYIFTVSSAKEIWLKVIKYLYKDGESLNITSKNSVLSIVSPRIDQGLVLTPSDNTLVLKFEDIIIGIKPKNIFQEEEIKYILDYMMNSNDIDQKAVYEFSKTSKIISTYRPCYSKLICEQRDAAPYIDINLIIEGKPLHDKINECISIDS